MDRRRVVLEIALVVLGTACWLAPPAPIDHVAGDAPVRMHIAEIVPTDAAFHEPTRAFHGDAAYWRVTIRDARNQPVAAARVAVDVVAPDGGVRARPTTVTGSDGLARFSLALSDTDRPGVYTLRVVSVSNLARQSAQYDTAANDAWASSFSVTRSPRQSR